MGKLHTLRRAIEREPGPTYRPTFGPEHMTVREVFRRVLSATDRPNSTVQAWEWT